MPPVPVFVPHLNVTEVNCCLIHLTGEPAPLGGEEKIGLILFGACTVGQMKILKAKSRRCGSAQQKPIESLWHESPESTSVRKQAYANLASSQRQSNA